MQIRNFWIIAHIDHGKSTLADRMLEITGTKEKREMKNDQLLDTMDIEQERGITIKLTPVRMEWNGYQLGLIDTPGHVDFQYEVSRSLASVEWVVLVVDATQWVEAQTLSNLYLALEHDLTIIPVINKIDLPSSNVQWVTNEITNLIGCDPSEIIPVSAKMGTNVDQVLDAIIDRIPAPKVLEDQDKNNETNTAKDETKALIFDSQYDPYRWIVIYVKLFSGSLKRGDKITFLHPKKTVEILEVGCFKPEYFKQDSLQQWEVGYIISGIKTLKEAQVGDTIYSGPDTNPTPIPGFKKVTPFVYAGVYPIDTTEYNQLKDDIEKLKLNDSSLTSENEVSPALGHGFRCGFLGLLHMEIIKERLDREFNLDVIMTSPQVTYEVALAGDKRETYKNFEGTQYFKDGSHLGMFGSGAATLIYLKNPEELPEAGTYDHIREPIAKLEIICPADQIGPMMELAQDRRGIIKNQSFIDGNRAMLTYEIPMAEIITDFYDELKSRSSGYASMNYEFIEFRRDDLIKLDILVHGERIGAFSNIVHRDKAFRIGEAICKKLKESIPRQNFPIALQAAIGGKIVARQTISAYRKDVTSGLYGWDVSRKKKVLAKQKKGKKRMKQFGKVSIPSQTFVDILKK